MSPGSHPHLYVATPAYGCKLFPQFALSVLQLQAACIKNRIQISIDLLGNESLVQRGRNILTARFLKSNATHLMFIDADIAFSPDSVLKLLRSEKDVVSGVYAKKSIDWKQVVAKRNGPEPVHQRGLDFNLNIVGDTKVTDGIVEVLDTATGFLMIRRHVIELMCDKYPDLWVKNDIAGGTGVDSYCAIFDCMIDLDTRRYLSEDYSFCRRWQALDGKVHADITIPLGHIGTHSFAISHAVSTAAPSDGPRTR